MARCFFADAPPRVEVRGDLLFIIPEGCSCEIALTARTLVEFVALANKALAEFGARHKAAVVQFPAH